MADVAEAGGQHCGGGAGEGKVWVVWHPACEGHHVTDHPEQPARLPAIVKAFATAFPSPRVHYVADSPRATPKQLAAFHTKKHLAKLSGLFQRADQTAQRFLDKHLTPNMPPKDELRIRRKAKSLSSQEIDGDTVVVSGTGEAALRAAGAACSAVDAVMSGTATSAFVAVRPPGHHAEPGEAMGFCFLNNICIAAHHAVNAHGARRVAVLDWDVHHGNGSEAGLQLSKNFLFASSHQFPCYPGTGKESKTGKYGNVVNCQLKPGSGSKAFRKSWTERILPATRAFVPDLILVSAGFDAHAEDPLADINLTDDDYYWVQSEVMKVAHDVCGGRVVSVLEGGYNLQAIARAAVQCLGAQVAAVNPSGGGGGDAEVDELVDELLGLDMSAGAALPEGGQRQEAEDYLAGMDLPTSEDDGDDEDADKLEEEQAADPLDEQPSHMLAPPVAAVAFQDLESVLLTQFEKCRALGVLRTDPYSDALQRRCIPGPHGFAIAFDAAHYAQKRATGLPARVPINTPFNSDKFHFGKASQEEKLLEFHAAGVTHPVLANISPLMPGHCVVPLFCEEGRPQVLSDLDAVEAAVSLASLCPLLSTTTAPSTSTSDVAAPGHPSMGYRVGFNSLGAFASINHLHLHIMFAQGLAGRAEGAAHPNSPHNYGFAIEHAAVQTPPLAHLPEGVNVAVCAWAVPCLVCSAPRPTGLGALARGLWRLLQHLEGVGTPYNLLFAPEGGRVVDGRAGGEPSILKVFVVPRKPQEYFDPSTAGFNGAVCEISGLLIASSQEKFDSLSDEQVTEALMLGAGLEPTAFADVVRWVQQGGMEG